MKAKRVAARQVAGKEPFALAQIREATQALLAEGKSEEAFEYFLAALAAVLRKNSELELLLMKLRRERLGTRSERMSPEQLIMMLEGVVPIEAAPKPDTSEQSRQDAVVEQEIESLQQAAREPAHSRGRSWRARNVKRQIHHRALPEADRICPACGRAQRRIGEDITRTAEYVPAHFTLHEYHLEKYACGTCKVGVSTASAPAKVIERSEADASVLAHVVVSKYADHTPLHRLQRIYKRSGVEIPVSTLADWVAGVGERIEPLAALLSERLLRSYVVRTDATGLKVLDPSSPENIERGTVWCYMGDDRDVVFRTRRREKARAGRGNFWLAGKATSRPMRPASLTASSLARQPARSKWAAERMRGASSWHSRIRIYALRIRCS